MIGKNFNFNGKNLTGKRRAILKKVRKQRLRYIAVLPSFITLINAICGFASITIASKGFMAGEARVHLMGLKLTNFGLAGLMIFIAMIADMLDGRVARMSHSTSSFGGQLDSLCDAVSFGIAPAFLVFQYLNHEIIHLVNPPLFFKNFIFRFVWLSCAVYVACTVVRLARFNVENEEDESAHMSFTGLPSPAAAGVLASLVIFIQDLYVLPGNESMIYKIAQTIIVYSLPFVTLAIGLLMIGRVVYPHVVNRYFRGKKPLTHLIGCVAVIGLIIWSFAFTLVFAFVTFALSGVLRTVFERRSRKKGLVSEP